MMLRIEASLRPYDNNHVEMMSFIKTDDSYDEGRITVKILDKDYDSTEFQVDLEELIEALEALKKL